MTTPEQEPEINSVYKEHPEIFAYFKIEDGKMSFDYNDTQVSVPEMMIIIHSTVTEYLKNIATQFQQQVAEQKQAEQKQTEEKE